MGISKNRCANVTILQGPGFEGALRQITVTLRLSYPKIPEIMIKYIIR